VVQGPAVHGFKQLSEVADFLNHPNRYTPIEMNRREELHQPQFMGQTLKDVKVNHMVVVL